MQAPSDAELLAEYATCRSEAAFARLVERYVALVHSAARRQVSDPHLAEEITQAVFILLARKAGSLARQTVLAGWLCRTAHFAARDALRTERRRLHREQLAAHMDTTPDAAWQQLAPLLDEAVAQLREADRDAIVLRYYEQRSLDETGAALGIGADAAQKRVARALEKLRAIFTKRGVTLTGAAIAGAVSANAIQAAPVGLAAKISAAAVLAGTTLAATTAVVITTLQKTIIGATLAAAVGVGIYEARQAANARAQIQVLKRQQSPLVEQVQQLQRERNEVTNLVVGLREEIERLNRNKAGLARLRAEVTRLRANETSTNIAVTAQSNPDWPPYIQVQDRAEAALWYEGRLLLSKQRLNLTREQAAAAERIGERITRDSDSTEKMPDYDAEFKALLTPEQMKRFDELAEYPSDGRNHYAAITSAAFDASTLARQFLLTPEQQDKAFAALTALCKESRRSWRVGASDGSSKDAEDRMPRTEYLLKRNAALRDALTSEQFPIYQRYTDRLVKVEHMRAEAEK